MGLDFEILTVQFITRITRRRKDTTKQGTEIDGSCFTHTMLLAVWKTACRGEGLAIRRVVQQRNNEALNDISGCADHRRGWILKQNY